MLWPYAYPISSLWNPLPDLIYTQDITLALGIRIRTDPFTNNNYNDLLRGYRGRAALLYGGLVGRIVLDVLDWQLALQRPSSCHMKDDFYKIDGQGYVDDMLTNDELDIICSVYRVLRSEYASRPSY